MSSRAQFHRVRLSTFVSTKDANESALMDSVSFMELCNCWRSLFRIPQNQQSPLMSTIRNNNFRMPKCRPLLCYPDVLQSFLTRNCHSSFARLCSIAVLRHARVLSAIVRLRVGHSKSADAVVVLKKYFLVTFTKNKAHE